MYFWHISSCFYSNFDRESSLDAELNSASNEYALGILLTDPATPKTRNTWKNMMMMHTFDGPRYPKNKKYLKKRDDDPATPKTRNTWKNMMMMSSSRFFRYFLFLGSGVHQKYAKKGTCWMQNLIPHPTSSPDQNLSKNTGRYVENTNKKVVFLWYLSTNLY